MKATALLHLLATPRQSFGQYQTTLRMGRRVFLGIGHTPAESRRNAIEAANEATGSQIASVLADRLCMVTEATVKGSLLA